MGVAGLRLGPRPTIARNVSKGRYGEIEEGVRHEGELSIPYSHFWRCTPVTDDTSHATKYGGGGWRPARPVLQGISDDASAAPTAQVDLAALKLDDPIALYLVSSALEREYYREMRFKNGNYTGN